MITENISTLKIQKLTKDQFQNGLENNILDDTSIYLTPVEVKDYALKSDLNTKADLIDGKVPASQIPEGIVDLSGYYTKTETDEEINLTKENFNTELLKKADLVDGKIPTSQLPDNIGGEVAWEDIKNKPFGKTGWEYTWNGNTEGLEVISVAGGFLNFYKVSSDFIERSEIIGASYEMYFDSKNNIGVIEETFINDGTNGSYVVLFNDSTPVILVTIGAGTETIMGMEVEIPSVGIWLPHFSEEEYPSYVGKIEIKKIGKEFLPDDISVNVDLSDYYTKNEINLSLSEKADLIDGKIPVSQIPDDIGGGITSWNDLTDKPFYDGTILIEPPTNISEDNTILSQSLGALGGMQFSFVKYSEAFATPEETYGGLIKVNHNGKVLDFIINDSHLNTLNNGFVLIDQSDTGFFPLLINVNSSGTTILPTAGILGEDLTIEVANPGAYFLYIEGLGSVISYSNAAFKYLDTKFIPDIYLKTAKAGVANGVATLDADGKVPLSQLPDDIGGGGGNNPIAPGSQIQTDYNQNDDTQIDYIKNRPFYTVPPKHNLNLNLPRAKTTISWDGVIQPNHPKVEFSMDGSLMTYYKVNNDFINSQNVLYGHAKYQFLPESLNEFEMEGLKDYQAIFPLSPDTMTNIVFADNNDLFFGMMLVSSTTAGEIPVDALGISLTIPEPGTYFLSDLEGNLIGPGYLSDIEGEIFIDLTDPDVLNNPNYIIEEDLFGSDTLFFAEKLVDSFIPVEQFVNGTVRLNQVSWDPDNFGEGSASMEMIIPEDLLLGENIIIGDDGISYVILMEGSLPIIASINSLTETFGGMLSVNGPGTYLCYSNLNKDAQGNEFWIDKLITQETVFQIDSKYIPKQKTFVPDYNEMDPASDSYIANRPYYSASYYNYYQGDASDISLRVAPNNDGTVFYQWGYELYDFQNPEIYDKGYMDAIVKYVNWNNLNIENSSSINYSVSTASGRSGQKILYVYTYNSNYSKIYWDTFGFQDSNYNAIIAYISLEDNITAEIPMSWNSNTYDYTTVTFPKKGVYYLHSIKDPNNQIYLNRLDLYRERKNIQIQTTNEVEQYTDIPISSRGVYEALGYRDSITTSNYPSNNSSSKDLITTYGLYKGLNSINDYINSYSDNYKTSSLRYRGTSLSSYESTPSQNGTIAWQYE